jgi:tRNA pseudouridine55 synthase
MSNQDIYNSTNGWLNIYKPRGISSAGVVGKIKKTIYPSKIGHAGTLDVEAEGVLPIGIGEATKLMRVLVDSKKKYLFTVKFGAKTDTGDSSGKIIDTTAHIPSHQECLDICGQFIGNITQIPPAFSAIKVSGVRSYNLARKKNELVKLPERNIKIYNLECIDANYGNATATYIAECSKGTYIRTLAEDISLSLQSLGFVIELRRIQVGKFNQEHSLILPTVVNRELIVQNLLEIDYVLDDILALNISYDQMILVRQGKSLFLENIDTDLICIKYNDILVAIGSVENGLFKSLRVFNLNIYGEM